VFNRRKPEEQKLETAAAVADAGRLPVAGEAPKPVLPPALSPAVHAPDDNGLDVPPYRPAPFAPTTLKETPMARSPFAPPLPPAPSPGIRPATPPTAAGHEAGERRTLVVGRGISVQGTVQDAERLVVEGTVEATMINGLTELSITHGGVFKGEVEVDEAEVAGTIDGTLTARHALIVRATGRVLGTARCRRLQVEDGGQITGRIEMLGDTPVFASEAG
jgi:cytoskeletal protein CcmA (bactofilin family)